MNTRNTKDIKDKIVTLKDITKLYEILMNTVGKVQSSDLFNNKFELEPQFIIVQTPQTQHTGTDIKELVSTLDFQKQPILSIELALYIRHDARIRIVFNKSRKFYPTSFYDIQGPDEWIASVTHEIGKVINNMSATPVITRIISRYFYALQLAIMLIITLLITINMRNVYATLDQTTSFITIMFQTLIISFSVYSALDFFRYDILFNLNNDYIDPDMDKRKKLGVAYTIIIGLLSVLSFFF